MIGFLRFFANPLVIVLLVASVISITPGDPVGGLIIIAMVLLSVLLNFFMEFQGRHAMEALPLVGTIALLTLTYLVLVQVVKTWFYRRHALL